MKFKVGDRVKVRKNLIKGRIYGKWDFGSSMEEWKNKTMTITDVFSDCYRVKENDWSWTDEMLEDVEEKKRL